MEVTPPSEEELSILYKDLFQTEKLPLFRSLCMYVPLCASGVLPNPLTQPFDSSNLKLSFPDFLNKCEVFETYNITANMGQCTFLLFCFYLNLKPES